MDPSWVYIATGLAIFAMGVHGLAARTTPLRKICANNISGVGVLLVLVALAARGRGGEPDPVPQAMVLTGLVLAVAGTGLALALQRSARGEESPDSVIANPKERTTSA